MRGYNVYLPIVEFEAEGALARFEEHKLLAGGEGIGWTVPVLYDPADHPVAMIDRSYWNWFPWGPALAIAVLLLFASTKASSSFCFKETPNPLQVSKQLAFRKMERQMADFDRFARR